MGFILNQTQSFRSCDICVTVLLCRKIDSGKIVQPRLKIERVPSCIWLCANCCDDDEQLELAYSKFRKK